MEMINLFLIGRKCIWNEQIRFEYFGLLCTKTSILTNTISIFNAIFSILKHFNYSINIKRKNRNKKNSKQAFIIKIKLNWLPPSLLKIGKKYSFTKEGIKIAIFSI